MMKNCLLLVLGAVLSCAALSCAAPRAKQSALVPAIQLAWQGVSDDVVRGVHADVEGSTLVDAAPILAVVNHFDEVIHRGQAAEIALLSWDILEPFARDGIADRLHDGQIGNGVAASLLGRLERFSDALKGLSQ